MKSSYQTPIYLLLNIFIVTILFVDGQHASKGLKVKSNKCFKCHTLDDGEDCQHANRLDNDTHVCDCSANGYCMVRSFAYSVNGTDLKVWMTERKCVSTCTNECVITGDRNKLHLCTSCCQEHLCNVGNGAHLGAGHYALHLYLLCSFIMLYCFIGRIAPS